MVRALTVSRGSAGRDRSIRATMSASTCSRVSPGRVRRSTVNTQRSGMVDSPVPPLIREACRLPGPRNGWRRPRSCRSTRSRATRWRPAARMASAPRWGREPWAATPVTVTSVQTNPRWAVPACRSVGSVTTAASILAGSRCVSASWMPRLAAASSSGSMTVGRPPAATSTPPRPSPSLRRFIHLGSDSRLRLTRRAEAAQDGMTTGSSRR
jgi:hypothetical protein